MKVLATKAASSYMFALGLDNSRSSLSPGPVGSVAELGVSMDACVGVGVGVGLQVTPPGLGVH